ncbi:mandelate racemase/muconate lactonizing enzyme family protein [Chitinophaga pollutisoli]|uniref:Mandelate racemase/muconate lactonizing enzyme family protein n=1 Tax=Chitinophaga pollutisoli TaxID=3133966 RepID=A0ABZ2YV25_9BACT
MKITKIETVHVSHLLMLRVHTDAGIIGNGETFYAPTAVAALLHDWMSEKLLGANPLDIEKHWRFFYQRFMNFGGRGAEMRAISALDLALWDILAQSCNQPVWRLLGGCTQSILPTYNSAGGTGYGVPVTDPNDRSPRPLFWPGHGSAGFDGPLEDNWASINRPAEYAEELLKEGYKAIKMWALDPLAHRPGGTLHLGWKELKAALAPLFKVRERVGYDIEIMLDGHGFFQWPAAMRIAEVMRDIRPLWMEDVLRTDNMDALKKFRDEAGVPIAVSEMLTVRDDYRQILEKGGADYIMIDPTWVGGISETRRITEMAIPYNIPVTMHDCTGPLTLLAGVQVGIANHNVVFQESVRAHLRVAYKQLIDTDVVVEQGGIAAPTRPGIGAAWQPELFNENAPSYRATVWKS